MNEANRSLNQIQALYDGLGRADAVLLAQTPALMMPRFSALPPLEPFRRRYVVARDGLYVQSRTPVLDLTLRVEHFTTPLPFGTIEESVRMAGGMIPKEIFRELRRRAVAHYPMEWAAFVLFDGDYRIAEPTIIDRSGGHVTYRTDGIDDRHLVLDIHSHGRFEASFSGDDDATDIHGTYFASVFGHCEHEDTVTCLSRLVVDGWRCNLSWHPWEE
jgi:PRTRC genetic system protein A